jgi:hypothetical protein
MNATVRTKEDSKGLAPDGGGCTYEADLLDCASGPIREGN